MARGFPLLANGQLKGDSAMSERITISSEARLTATMLSQALKEVGSKSEWDLPVLVELLAEVAKLNRLTLPLLREDLQTWASEHPDTVEARAIAISLNSWLGGFHLGFNHNTQQFIKGLERNSLNSKE